jgi:hypothetical protein
MDNLAAIIGQLSRLIWRDNRDESRRWYFPRVCREDPVNFLPYLQFGSGKADSQEGREEICIPPTYLTE